MKLFLTLAVLVLPPLSRADQIKSLGRGDQSFSAFYLAIQGAKQSIDVATYTIEPCQSIPKVLLNALAAKAAAGVKVRFVIEAWNMKEPAKSALPAWAAASPNHNFEIRYYGSSSLLEGDRPRSHIKAFIVDAKASASQIVGGRNWTDEYFGINDKLNFVDHDLLVSGDSAKNADKFFDALWAASSAVTPQGNGAAWAKTCLALSARDQAVSQFAKSKAATILGGIPQRSCDDTYYVADDPNFMSGSAESSGEGSPGDIISAERLAKKYATGLWLDFLDPANVGAEISFVNQYYMPWGRVLTSFDNLRNAKKKIDVVSNATGDIENNPTQNSAFTCYLQKSAAESSRGTQQVHLLTSRGALRDSWELSVNGTPWRIHAKTGIRDGKDVLVSSWNIDPRSYATNLEDGILVSGCPALAADVKAQYTQLHDAAKADETCAACGADIVKSNFTPGAFCGGAPSFY
jgi:putative cardiolipin synthase